MASPFAVVTPGTGEAFSDLARSGFRAFRYMGSGVATVNFPRGFVGHEFAHIPLTVWAISEEIARAEALRKLAQLAPAYRWSVSPAPHNEERKTGRPRKIA